MAERGERRKYRPGRGSVADHQEAPVVAGQTAERGAEAAVGFRFVAGPHHGDDEQPVAFRVEAGDRRHFGALGRGPVGGGGELGGVQKRRQVDQPVRRLDQRRDTIGVVAG